MNILSNSRGLYQKKKNTLLIIFFVVFFIAILAIEMFVHYYGDDYYFLTFLQRDFWKMHLFHYMHNNGRSIVHFLVTVFLALDIHLWYIVNAFFLTLTAYFINKLMGGHPVTAFIACAMILTMPVSLTNESVFWITGAFNYVYPSMILIIYWYIISKNDKRYNTFMYLIVFLLSASTEQGAVAAITLTICYDIISWICVTLLILMVIGNRAGDIKAITRFMYMLLTALVCAGCTGLYIFTSVQYYKRTKSIKPAVAVIVGICSCGFIILSPTIGSRILYMTDILFIIYICCIASNVLKWQRLLAIFAIIISTAAICNWFVTIHGYYTNDEIYYENEKMIEKYKQYPGDILIQKKLILEDYGWSMPYNSPYHEYYYKLYHGIPDETQILWN